MKTRYVGGTVAQVKSRTGKTGIVPSSSRKGVGNVSLHFDQVGARSADAPGPVSQASQRNAGQNTAKPWQLIPEEITALRDLAVATGLQVLQVPQLAAFGIKALLSYAALHGGHIALPLDFTKVYAPVQYSQWHGLAAHDVATEAGLVDLFSQIGGALQTVFLSIPPDFLESVLVNNYDRASSYPRVQAYYTAFATYIRAEAAEARIQDTRR